MKAKQKDRKQIRKNKKISSLQKVQKVLFENWKKSKGVDVIFQNNIYFLTEEVSPAVKGQTRAYKIMKGKEKTHSMAHHNKISKPGNKEKVFKNFQSVCMCVGETTNKQKQAT